MIIDSFAKRQRLQRTLAFFVFKNTLATCLIELQ